jgi:hypothetical protein
MSIDTTFKPLGPTCFVSNVTGTQVVQQGNLSGSGLSFRIRNLAATAQYIGWASTAAGATATAPSVTGPAGGQVCVGLLGSSVETFELPPYSYFIASTVTGFEVTPGTGA